MIEIQEQVPLTPYTTFHIGGNAQYFGRIKKQEEIPAYVSFAEKHHIPIHILGGGSNTIFGNTTIQQLILHMEESYIRILHTHESDVYIEVGAGTLWDEIVAWTTDRAYTGIEALSAIPGTVGAAPIQNIGAYGQEIQDTLIEVCAYDTKNHIFVCIPKRLCQFGYRTSIFKKEVRGRYIITSIMLKVSTLLKGVPSYPDIENYFKQNPLILPTPTNVRIAVQEIRKIKLPDPQKIPNAGSFFKNPIITQSQANTLQEKYPTLKAFPAHEGAVKISAGWLIEQCGLKGATIGSIGIYEKNALILTNTGKATYRDVIHAKEIITQKVFEIFHISLEMEPDCII
ncbi:MAG: UDP-N-acetylmuramate dehydrogenase [Candidatus Paceibacterota bacterium]